jgi:AraC-like DNA-binding protein
MLTLAACFVAYRISIMAMHPLREYFAKPWSPTHYLTECRILFAKKLLVSTPLAIKQIALEAGFGQSSYFISQFHRMTGMTPQQFREMYG